MTASRNQTINKSDTPPVQTAGPVVRRSPVVRATGRDESRQEERKVGRRGKDSGARGLADGVCVCV